jgi:hypothetical protein
MEGIGKGLAITGVWAGIGVVAFATAPTFAAIPFAIAGVAATAYIVLFF